MLDFERKDVWNMKWADDNCDLLAIMEKSRMYILRGTELEEPVPCTAYLCRFHALQVRIISQIYVACLPYLSIIIFGQNTICAIETTYILQYCCKEEERKKKLMLFKRPK
jgi:hypothetical protein